MGSKAQTEPRIVTSSLFRGAWEELVESQPGTPAWDILAGEGCGYLEPRETLAFTLTSTSTLACMHRNQSFHFVRSLKSYLIFPSFPGHHGLRGGQPVAIVGGPQASN